MARNKYPEVTIERILNTAIKLFLEKGYENTTIQNIIDELGDLSKGAIYYHFKSKEDIIFEAINKVYKAIESKFFKLKASKQLNGAEKLKQLFLISLEVPEQKEFAKIIPSLLKNPKLLVIQLETTMTYTVKLVEEIIREGQVDGSIKTEYPEELAEVMCVLSNIWINPFVFACSKEKFYRKCNFYISIMKSLNINIFDDGIIQKVECLRELFIEKD